MVGIRVRVTSGDVLLEKFGNAPSLENFKVGIKVGVTLGDALPPPPNQGGIRVGATLANVPIAPPPQIREQKPNIY